MSGRSAFLVNDTAVSGHPGCVTVMAVVRDQIEMRGLSIAGRWPMGAEPQFGLERSPALRGASVVIVNGEGTLHNTERRPGARRLINAIRRVRDATTAPVFFVNATIEALRPKDFAVLRLCDGLFLRDESSCRYAAGHGIGARLVPDLCFSADHSAPSVQAGSMVTDSTLPEATEMLRRWSLAEGAQYLPMQPSRMRSLLHWAVTPRLHERAAARYFASVAAASSLVTGRFHAAVFALMAGTPFLAIGSNTSKIHSLLIDALGADERVVAPDRLAMAGLSVPPFSDTERARIKAYRAAARLSSQAMFDHIADAAAHGGAGGR